MTPFSLPEKWVWSTLGDTCTIERGITFPATVQVNEHFENHIACLRTTNIQEHINWKDLIYIPNEFLPKNKNRRDLARLSDFIGHFLDRWYKQQAMMTPRSAKITRNVGKTQSEPVEA